MATSVPFCAADGSSQSLLGFAFECIRLGWVALFPLGGATHFVQAPSTLSRVQIHGRLHSHTGVDLQIFRLSLSETRIPCTPHSCLRSPDLTASSYFPSCRKCAAQKLKGVNISPPDPNHSCTLFSWGPHPHTTDCGCNLPNPNGYSPLCGSPPDACRHGATLPMWCNSE